MSVLRLLFRMARRVFDRVFPPPSGWQPSQKRNDHRFK